VHYRGGNYGADVNLPVPQAEENNPAFEGSACIDRKA
jgi:starch-binding outer membrane protein, SusD/RagB family